jgi:hypothetical protein
MGIALTVHSEGASLDVVLVLASDGSDLHPVSPLHFLSDPFAYSDRAIIIVEPKIIADPPAHRAQFLNNRLDFPETIATIRSIFNFHLVQTRGCRLWISVPVESEYPAFVRSIRDQNFASFRSSETVGIDQIFDGAQFIKSVSDAFRSASARPGFRGTVITDGAARSLPQIVLANDCDLIVPSVYVGNENSAATAGVLNALGITHVVGLGSSPQAGRIGGVQRCWVKLQDCPFATLTPEFWAAVDFVSEAVNAGGVVLIHCQKGISRSPALCIAYLIEKNGYSFQTALDLLKRQRPSVLLNPGFAEQLEKRAKQPGRRFV